jgi:enoyl-CoA hydratase/carnithine racemase
MALPDFSTLRTRSEGTVLFAQIDSPPLNMIGPEFLSAPVSLIEFANSTDVYRVVVFSNANPDFFISHVDLLKVAEYSAAAKKLTGHASIAVLFT